jgi:lysophospholipase L1-like esterase
MCPLPGLQGFSHGVYKRRASHREPSGAGWKELLAFLVLLCTSGCGTTFRVHPTVLFVGDSITHEWAQSYNGQQATFAANNWLDVGVLGFTSSQIVGEFNEYIPALKPKAVHIIAGTNDVYPGWQLSDTSNNIETMVKKAKANHSTVGTGGHRGTG